MVESCFQDQAFGGPFGRLIGRDAIFAGAIGAHLYEVRNACALCLGQYMRGSATVDAFERYASRRLFLDNANKMDDGLLAITHAVQRVRQCHIAYLPRHVRKRSQVAWDRSSETRNGMTRLDKVGYHVSSDEPRGSGYQYAHSRNMLVCRKGFNGILEPMCLLAQRFHMNTIPDCLDSTACHRYFRERSSPPMGGTPTVTMRYLHLHRMLVLVLGFCVAMPAQAQLRAVHVPSALPVDKPVVVFFQLADATDIEALAIALPGNLELISVERKGDRDWQPVRFQPVRDRPGRFFAPQPERGLYAMVVSSRAVTDTRSMTISAIGAGEPGVLRLALPGSTLSRGTSYRHARLTERSQTTGPAASVVWPSAAGSTMEFWMRTVRRDRVVASTWSGDEAQPYPLEVIVDQDGYVEVFRGDGSRHGSIRSSAPVADGLWYHVAVSSGEWMKLYVNGVPQDSLLTRMIPVSASGNSSAVSFGRRPGSAAGSFVGDMDEIRIWTGVRTRSMLRARMRQHTRTLEEAPVWSASFEDESPSTARSDLLLYRPPDNIQVVFDEAGARLTWTATEQGIRSFIVERRVGDRAFERVGVVPAGAAAAWSWLDAAPTAGILYYRIRQVHVDGASVASSSVKVGMGDVPAARELTARITANYPNPFRPQTTIAFQVDEPTHVRLTVWDLSGQLVRVLVDGVQSAGVHEVPFDGDGLPSGAYFARLDAEGRTQTHQMVLTK